MADTVHVVNIAAGGGHHIIENAVSPVLMRVCGWGQAIAIASPCALSSREDQTADQSEARFQIG